MTNPRRPGSTGLSGSPVWGGLLGSVMLLCRKRLALPLFVLSLLGMAVQMGYTYLLTPAFRI